MPSPSPTVPKLPPPPGLTRRGEAVRSIAFRVLASLWSIMLLVLFGTWSAILTPWVVVPDGSDHGWARTPELHRLADSAAAAVMGAVAIGLIVLAVAPKRRSGLAAWAAGSLAVFGALSPVSGLLQEHDPTAGVVTAVVWLGLVCVTFGVCYPERHGLARGGRPDEASPSAAWRGVFTAGTALGLLLALGAVVWRLTGNVFESRLEDDVISFVNLGLVFALGCWLCRAGRGGWRALSTIMAGVLMYAVVGGASLALG